MKEVVKSSEALTWESPESPPYRRKFGLMFERDITPTKNIAAGIVILPPKHQQPKASVHTTSEEIYYVVRGKGKFRLGDHLFEVEKGTAIYVAPGVAHQALNTGDEEMELYWVLTPPEGVFGPVGGYRSIVEGWKRV